MDCKALCVCTALRSKSIGYILQRAISDCDRPPVQGAQQSMLAVCLDVRCGLQPQLDVVLGFHSTPNPQAHPCPNHYPHPHSNQTFGYIADRCGAGLSQWRRRDLERDQRDGLHQLAGVIQHLCPELHSGCARFPCPMNLYAWRLHLSTFCTLLSLCAVLTWAHVGSLVPP